MANPAEDLQKDPLLQTAPSCEGFKVLEPAVLYARVGAGGMGAVYRGRHFSLECDVAVKVLKPELAHDEQFVARFSREAKLAARISNDNVVRVLDVKAKNGIHYLVMEFVQGETARERCKRKGPLKEQEALAIVLGAALGLRDAHAQGIVHRDIKPDNVLVSTQGAIKLADLGLAKQKQTAGDQNLTVLSSGVMGTPQFMPPEQWRTPDVTPAADVWALGATLWYLLAGKSAIPAGEMLTIAEHIRDHDFPSILDVRKDVRPEVAALLAKCTARKPEQRFADARELVKALRPLVAIDDDALRDAEAGLGNSNVAVVTPPPRATLARIKLQVEQDPDDVPTQPAGGLPGPGRSAAAGEPATEVRGAAAAAGATVAQPAPVARRSPWLAVALVVLAGAGAGGAWAAGWFGKPAPAPVVPPGNERGQPIVDGKPAVSPTSQSPDTLQRQDVPVTQGGTSLPPPPSTPPVAKEPSPSPASRDPVVPPEAPKPNATDAPAQGRSDATDGAKELAKDVAKDGAKDPPVRPAVDPAQEAKAALQRGLDALPRAAGLDTAIEAFERALQFDPALAEAKQKLVVALVQKHKQIVASDPDAAFDAAARAHQLAPADAAATAAFEAAVAAVQQRMAKGIRVRTPAAGSVLADPAVHVEGSVAVPNVRTVRVAVDGREGAAGLPFPATAVESPVVGGAFEANLRAAGDGAQWLRVQAADTRGPVGEMTPHAVVVDTRAPELAIEQPAAEALVGAEVDVVVRVTDVSPTTVTIGGKPAERRADGAFAARVPLADGAQEIAIVATDGARRETKQTRRVRVDASPPAIELAADLPKLTNGKQLRVRGNVRDANPVTLTLDGKPVAVAGDGSFDAPFAFAESRDYELRLLAKDAVGNTSAPTVVRVRYDGTPPVLAWTEPQAATLLAGDVVVRGTVQDQNPCEVLVNGTPAQVQDGQWNARVALAANADLVVQVTARDAAGNAAEPLQRTLRGEQPFAPLAWAVAEPDAKRVVIGDKVWPSVVRDARFGFRMVLVPAGEFTMGSPTSEAERGDDESAHRCVIQKPFWLGETEVTQEQWERTMGSNASKVRDGKLPVGNVSWDDCQFFVKALNHDLKEQTGFYRLPSEAEWEYACRAGTETPFAFGAALTSEQANFDGSRPYPGSAKSQNRNRVLPGKSLAANAFGLYDMHGNVQEWVQDNYAPQAAATEAPLEGAGNPVVRGGSWGSMASGCRSAFRFHGYERWAKNERVGLRLARSFDG